MLDVELALEIDMTTARILLKGGLLKNNIDGELEIGLLSLIML